MSTEMNGDGGQLMSSGGAPFPHQRNGEQASTEHVTVYRGSPAHRPPLIIKISPRGNFPFELRLCASFSSRISRTGDPDAL
jgi:hypothetical protein